jgi:hypothetical protein
LLSISTLTGSGSSSTMGGVAMVMRCRTFAIQIVSVLVVVDVFVTGR